MAIGDGLSTAADDLADIFDRDNAEIERLTREKYRYAWYMYFFAFVSCVLMVSTAAMAFQERNVPSHDPAEWSKFTSDENNTWIVRDSAVFAILDVSDEEDARKLGRKCMIYLPGLTIGSKLSMEEISQQVKNFRDADNDR